MSLFRKVLSDCKISLSGDVSYGILGMQHRSVKSWALMGHPNSTFDQVTVRPVAALLWNYRAVLPFHLCFLIQHFPSVRSSISLPYISILFKWRIILLKHSWWSKFTFFTLKSLDYIHFCLSQLCILKFAILFVSQFLLFTKFRTICVLNGRQPVNFFFFFVSRKSSE